MQQPLFSQQMAKSFSLLFLSSLSLLSALAQTDEFLFNGFHSGNSNSYGNITLDGIAEINNGGILQLTNETLRLIGHAFYPVPLHFKNSTDGSIFSFSTAFAFAIVPEYPKLGGHGLAFTIANSSTLRGALPSQYLGLLNAKNIGNASNHLFAVEFDTVQDFEFGDINDNHVGVDLNNLASNKSVPAPLNLKSGETIQAWIDYDGARKVVDVWLDTSSTKPSTDPILSYAVDLSPVLLNEMYVGFSASTGLLASSHYLFGWSFKMNGVTKSLDLSSLPSLPKPKKKNYALLIAAPVSALLFLIAALTSAGYLFYKIKTADIIEAWELVTGPHRFSYKELKHATRGFREKGLLGQGGFGKVYRGVLPGTKEEIAVKRVSHESKQGLREFVAEIASIGRLRHRNLVQLQGWCRRRADLLLVYEYMPNGSLDKYLFGGIATSPVLPWPIRFRIIRSVAAALLYLHEEWEHVVLHRDVKASNVLLDGELNGRLGDFGLAKLYERGANPTTTRVVGTLGYLAPELTRTGKATTATDVFAFGALALEVVSGRRPIEPKADPEELVLVDWVWEKWAARNWREVVDPRIVGEFDDSEVEVALRVGLMCSHPAPVERPAMRDVVRFLEDGDPSGVPELRSPPPPGGGRYEVGFEDFLHSYPSSSFEKASWSSNSNPVGGKVGGTMVVPEEAAPFVFSSPV